MEDIFIKSKYMSLVDNSTDSSFLPPVYKNSCSSEVNKNTKLFF